ncbi:MAG: hypothetical protein CME64_17170 [Halobacteriovoraceae bacterium]|nr:hypothetical protein [Halobacteriovoraceae bacterium]|tara:strand:- start:257732 stop:258913 length:1182 start_codon:yes stop_codon:yes gene_type:complete
MHHLSQEDYTLDPQLGLKLLGGMNMVLHCHHYNARLQRTLEQNKKVDGKKIIRETAATIYWELFSNILEAKEQSDTIIEDLYRFLGFGILDLSRLKEGKITSPFSHYVEGWNCGAIKTEGTVCRVTEGFLEGAIKAVFNKDVSVEELCCANQANSSVCEFKVTPLDMPKNKFEKRTKNDVNFITNQKHNEATSNIDKGKVINAVIRMPLEGNNEGLIPSFNVYLAHTPQEFYNLLTIRFIKEMEKVGFGDLAKEMLVEDAEHCALNTFGGILESEEWEGLVRPMVKVQSDKLFGLVAVANGLGWGRCHIAEHHPYEALKLCSTNGYEAYGYIEAQGHHESPQCFMLRGISAGLMALVYEKGDFEERAGKFTSEETCCLVSKDPVCEFSIKREV